MTGLDGAKSVLAHYFRYGLSAAGYGDTDLQAEVDGAVDSIVDEAAHKGREELLFGPKNGGMDTLGVTSSSEILVRWTCGGCFGTGTTKNDDYCTYLNWPRRLVADKQEVAEYLWELGEYESQPSKWTTCRHCNGRGKVAAWISANEFLSDHVLKSSTDATTTRRNEF